MIVCIKNFDTSQTDASPSIYLLSAPSCDSHSKRWEIFYFKFKYKSLILATASLHISHLLREEEILGVLFSLSLSLFTSSLTLHPPSS